MHRIKGKRERKIPDNVGANGQPRKRGRPMKSQSDLTIPRDALNEHLKSYREYLQSHTNSEKCALSPFENLPNELIQHIFFLSFETNLPRASPHFAFILSTEATFRALTLFAYFENDNTRPVEVKHFLPAEYRYLSLDERIRLQRGIVKCRWFTLNRLQSYLPSLSRLKMVQAWHEEHDKELELVEELEDVSVTSASDLLPPVARLPNRDNQGEMELHFWARSIGGSTGVGQQQDDSDAGTHLPYITTWNLGLSTTVDSKIAKTRHGQSSVIAAYIIPDWLLCHGPWTITKIKLLQLLRLGLHHVNSSVVLEISAAAVLDGIACAIRESQVEALKTVLELHSAVFAIADEDETHLQPRLTPRTCCPIPIELFHLASRQPKESCAMLWLLIRAEVDTVRHNDTILTGWAIKTCGAKETSLVPKWLLHHMDGSNDYELRPGEYLFVRGQLPQRLRNTELEFPEASQTFAQELGYQLGNKVLMPAALNDGSYG